MNDEELRMTWMDEQGFRRGAPADDEREISAFADRLYEVGLRAPDSTKALLVFKEFRRGAPADNERQALAALIDAEFDEYRPIYNEAGQCVDSNAADAVLAAGFRRGAPAEPVCAKCQRGAHAHCLADNLLAHFPCGCEHRAPAKPAVDWKAVAESCDALLRAVMDALDIRPDQDPVIEARKIAERAAEPAVTDEVLVEDSWFKRDDLPEVLGNYMHGG